jgi:hypothetical protein
MDGYLESAFSELFNEDGLLIMGPGLGIINLLANFIKLYSSVKDLESQKKLVFCINLHDTENIILDILHSQGCFPNQLPKVTNNDDSNNLVYFLKSIYF